MPDLSNATPPAVAIPRVIDPSRFEDFPAFRETFLSIFTTPEHNAALRTFGDLLFELVLEFRGYWPDQPEGSIRTELRALVGDLRVIQGHLASVAESNPSTPQEGHHARVAVRLAGDVGAIADALASELGTWRGEA